ncbi:MAG: sugar kinase [Melioribacteraceae bacterium]|nr:sugar kinase [Melioribacteraceae bacterium]
MSLLIVGSLAYDSIETPYEKVEDALGGSSSYISLASSYFTKPIEIVGVVGDDFKSEHLQLFKDKNIGLEGVQIIEGGKTFRWGGKYHHDFNQRDTIYTDLNVFADFNPVIPESCKESEYVMLGNIDPALQLSVLDQVRNSKFVVCDTMNLWIDIKKDDLLKVLKRIDVIIVNDSEAKLLTSEPNLIKAAKLIKEMGPKIVIIKKGEHGALLFAEDKIFSAPALPMEVVFDPTGAGDTFAGGFIGYLHRTKDHSFENLKRAVVYGSTLASFCVEHFSTKGIENLDTEKIKNRFNQFVELARFEDDEQF